MNKKLEKIPIPFVDFEHKLSKNSKVLFSGIFGSGKSTFLNDFFNSNDHYSSIHIYPVNYSVASNKDIFELIKYDILFQLIGRLTNEEFDKIEIPYHLTVLPYLLNKNDFGDKIDFFSSFLAFAGEYGKGFLRIYDQLKKLKVGFEEFHKEFQKDDLEFIKSYLEKKTTKLGHIYEEDFCTELIRNLLGKLKDTSGVKGEVVLVIDDLDRLDPDHIFRLLNIFSAHFDFLGVESDNKFDFDKVVLVCDYNNVQSVFEHKYGRNADFNGYINKFYSSIYWHRSSAFIKKIIHTYLGEIKTELSYNLFDSSNRIGGQIRYVLEQMLDYNLISFRELIKFEKKYDLRFASNAKVKQAYMSESILSRHNLNGEHVVLFLLFFFDNDYLLLTKLKRAREFEIKKGYDYYDEDGKDKICDLLILLNYSALTGEHFNGGSDSEISLEYGDYVFECSPIKKDYNISVKCNRILKDCTEVSADELSYFEVLIKTVVLYRDFIKEAL